VGESTKRERSRRTIAAGSATLAALPTHKARQAERRLAAGSAWSDEGLVSDRGDGQAMSNEVFAHRLGRAAEAAGVPVITPHRMRNTCATLLLATGVHPRAIASQGARIWRR
jgi:integrase